MQTSKLEKEGYFVIDFFDLRALLAMRKGLLDQLRSLTGQNDLELENYHDWVKENDQRHMDITASLTNWLRSEKPFIPVFQDNLKLFIEIFGPDIDIEREPYLRSVRPHKPQDNIGYHRDTNYGGSPYEISVFIPFMDLDESASLQLEPGSHIKSASEIPFNKTNSQDPTHTKGSLKHRLGFPFQPQILDPSYSRKKIQAIPVRFGQAIAFCFAILHGTEVNASQKNRWSCDVRLKQAFIKREGGEHRFQPLSRGPVTKAGDAYLEACANEKLEIS